MSKVLEVKPSLSLIKTNKPKGSVVSIKPSLSLIGREQVTYVENIVAYKGQPMGLLLSLTYPVDTILRTTIRL